MVTDDVDNVLILAKLKVNNIVSGSRASDRDVIARYTAIFSNNFINWLLFAFKLAKSQTAKDNLSENISCELKGDHPGMLRNFAISANSFPFPADFEYTAKVVMDVSNSQFRYGWLYAVVLLALLENTSLVFIPDLQVRAIRLGGTDMSYTTAHGEADVQHAMELKDAVISEVLQDDTNLEIQQAVDSLVDIIKCIYYS